MGKTKDMAIRARMVECIKTYIADHKVASFTIPDLFVNCRVEERRFYDYIRDLEAYGILRHVSDKKGKGRPSARVFALVENAPEIVVEHKPVIVVEHTPDPRKTMANTIKKLVVFQTMDLVRAGVPKHTAKRFISECLDAGYIVVEKRGKDNRTLIYRYAGNGRREAT